MVRRKTLTKKIEAHYEGRLLVEAMANLRSSKTGVEGVVIWISPGEFESKKSQQGPRIKVAVGTKMTAESLKDAVSVTLTIPPRVLGELTAKVKKQTTDFILLNMDVLLQHWRGELDSEEVLKKIRSI